MVGQPVKEVGPEGVVAGPGHEGGRAPVRGRGVRQVGVAGWKWFSAAEASDPALWVDAPSFIVDMLRSLGCVVVNATGLFTAPGSGLRLVNDADQLASFEFAATHGSESM